MTKSYEFNWQKHLPEFMQEGASFDRFDEVGSSAHRSQANFSVLSSSPALKDHSSTTHTASRASPLPFFELIV